MQVTMLYITKSLVLRYQFFEQNEFINPFLHDDSLLLIKEEFIYTE